MNQEKRIYEKYAKRPLDFVLSLIALITLSPLLIGVAVLVKLKLGSPVIFFQNRPGKGEKIFKIYKFRTMSEQKGKDGKLLPDGIRLTRFGKILRATSIDELPELWNIIRGDMSIVGPRPLLVEYLSFYNDKQKKRHEVRPGLTGLAQVNGRNRITWEEKFNMDVEYTKNISFVGDCKILLYTIRKVIMREGINSKTSVTVEPFSGNKPNQ